MMMPTWWEGMGAEARSWLARHPHSDVPAEIADQIESAGGVLLDATWISAGRSTPVRFLNPNDQLWVEWSDGPG